MKTIVLTLFCYLSFYAGYTQTTFQMLYSGYDYDNAVDVIRTNDNGFLITGYTYSSGAGGYDILIIKTDNNGSVEWAKTYGTATDDFAYQAIKITDEEYIVLGITGGIFNPNTKIILFKINDKGDLNWSKSYVGGDQIFIPTNIYKTSDGGFVIGATNLVVNTGTDFYIIKCDSNGDVQWNRIIGTNEYDFFSTVIETSDGNYLLSGTIHRVASNDDIILVKTDKNGNILWNKVYQRSSDIRSFEGPVINGLLELENEHYVMIGFTDYRTSAFILKTDNDGNIKWFKIFTGSDRALFNSIEQTEDKDFLISGLTSSIGPGTPNTFNAFILKIDSSASIQWIKVFGGLLNESVNSSIEIDDGYVIVGTTNSCGSSNQDIFLMKTDKNGINDCFGYAGDLQVKDAVYNIETVTLNVNSHVIVGGINLIIEDFYPVTTSICNNKELDKENIKVYPNPFQSSATLSIKFKDDDPLCPSFIGLRRLKLTIYDVLGRKVEELDITNDITNTNDRIEINISRENLLNAIYFWRLTNENNVVIKTGKIVAF